MPGFVQLQEAVYSSIPLPASPPYPGSQGTSLLSTVLNYNEHHIGPLYCEWQ